MPAFIPEFFIQLDKPGILNMKSKGYRLSMSSWNKVYDNEDWFFNTESCVLLDEDKVQFERKIEILLHGSLHLNY